MKSISPLTQPQPGPFCDSPQVLAASLTTQVTRFLMSSGLATVIHWAVMGLLIGEGLHPVLATTIGALTGSVFNYTFLFYWTFNGTGIHGKAIPAYACTVIFGWCANAVIFYFLISSVHAGLALAQVCTTAAVAVINFVLYKRMVFHERTA